MQAYELLYPYAVICIAIVASICTIIAGLYAFVTMLCCMPRASILARKKARAERDGWSPTPPGELCPTDVLPYILGGTGIFVAACLAAMIELKLGAYVALIGCS